MPNLAVAFVDTRLHGFPGMDQFFKLAKHVVVAPFARNLYIDQVVPVDDMSLTTLAGSMAFNLEKKPGYSALIYTHGEPRNILFPIDPTTPKRYVDAPTAARLSYHLDLIQQHR